MQTLLQYSMFRILDHARCSSPWLLSPLRDLLAHDSLGGHLCSRHIGQSPEQLRARLASSISLTVASSFWSMETARASVCYLTMHHLADIINWACSSTARISIEGPVPVRSSIGYAIKRGGDTITLCRAARMVLKRDLGSDFHIRTAFPIP